MTGQISLPEWEDENLNEVETTNTEIADDMPDFEENTAEMPCESEKSADECTDSAENAIVSEEKAEESADTETEKAKEDYISQPEQRILDEMNRRVSEDGDELLSTAMQSADKNIHDCYKYVTFCARKEMEKIMKGKSSGGVMIDDPVVYGWAHHYYIESKETIDAEMKPKVKETPKTAPKADTKKTAKKGKKKAKETPKPIKNVIDLSKVITAKKPEEDGKKKTKREKKKDSLSAGFVPMERPDCKDYEKEAKKGSREQAKSIAQMDLGLVWDEE